MGKVEMAKQSSRNPECATVESKDKKDDFWVAPEWALWVLAALMGFGCIGAVVIPILK